MIYIWGGWKCVKAVNLPIWTCSDSKLSGFDSTCILVLYNVHIWSSVRIVVPGNLAWQCILYKHSLAGHIYTSSPHNVGRTGTKAIKTILH